MRIGQDTEIRSYDVVKTWKKIKANGGKWNGFILCKYCSGAGVKMDRLKMDSDKKKTQPCPHCKGWGFMRTGNGTDTVAVTLD